jgi:hypothetical protein
MYVKAIKLKMLLLKPLKRNYLQMKRPPQMLGRLKRDDLEMKRPPQMLGRLKRNDLEMKRPRQMLGRLKRNDLGRLKRNGLQMPLPRLLKRKDAKILRRVRIKQSVNNWSRPRQKVGSTPPCNQKTVTAISATLTT